MSDGLDDPTRPAGHRLRLPVPLALLLIVIAIATAAVIAVSVGGDATPFVPVGYYGQVTTLSAEAAAELASLAPASVLAACLDGEAAACEQQRRNVRAAANRALALQQAFVRLAPPARAVAWHRDYRDALVQLTEALFGQAEALDQRDAGGFENAVERTRAAVAIEAELTARFNREFADQFRGE